MLALGKKSNFPYSLYSMESAGLVQHIVKFINQGGNKDIRIINVV